MDINLLDFPIKHYHERIPVPPRGLISTTKALIILLNLIKIPHQILALIKDKPKTKFCLDYSIRILSLINWWGINQILFVF